MPHLLIAGKVHPSGLALLDGAEGVTYDYVEEITEASYAPLIGKADGLVIRTQPLTAATIDKASRLQVVSRHGVGYDAVDVAALNKRKIPLCVAGDANSLSVAEHAMALILASAKRLIRADHSVRSGAWLWRNRLEASEISAKNLLIVGYGRTGRRLARMAQGFDMQIRAFDPFLAQHGWPDGPVASVASLEDALAWADVISVHAPKSGRPILGREEFAQMKPSVIIVNTARGGIVDEAALAEALAQGRIGAAGIDVFDDEPPTLDHPLLAFDQVALSPHIAGLTEPAAERMAVYSIQNALDFFAGRLDSDLVVNKDFDMTKPKLRVGLIGSGFMGKAHAFGYTTAARVFDLPFEVELHSLADINDDAAAKAAAALGFARSTSDWRAMVADPEIDIVNITAPNAFHKEMALVAIAAGKHVYCEKPLAPLAADAREMADAAEARGVKTQVGFNYLCNPMLGLAREMIAAGELGEIRGYRGVHAEDYMADSAGPFTFRHDPAGGGALADIGSHALATAEFLMGSAAGPIVKVMGDCVTMIGERSDGKGGKRKVEVDDVGRAFLRFASGASGSIEGNWISTGRKMQHDFEVYGSKGALAFSQERFNELHFFSTSDARGRQGFRRIEAGPDHAPYGLFCVAAGHQIGFNDLKAIEVAGYLDAVVGRRPEPFNFRAGLRIQTLVETIHASSRQGGWLEVR